jgi:sigma-B regulation protein RsbU (phosphoserine phosphatase)
MGANGPRLGHVEDASYEDNSIEFKSNDAIIFYTDGIIECTNNEGKEWGQRKFIKSLCANIQKEAADARDAIISEAETFYEGNPHNDDVTIVITKMN